MVKQRLCAFESVLTKRIIASLIDYGLYFGICYAFMRVFGEIEDGRLVVTGSKTLVLPALWLASFPYAEGRFGQTLGKAVFGLHVVGDGPHEPGFVGCLQRRLADAIDLFFFFGVPAIMTVRASEKGQRLGDIWAKTIVVEEQKVECSNCGEEVILDGRDVLRSSYTCPYCEKLIQRR